MRTADDGRSPMSELRGPAVGGRARRAVSSVPAAARPRRRPLERPRALRRDGRAGRRASWTCSPPTVGALPRVDLRDTEAADRDEPLEKPNSPEMPDPADRPARLQLFGEIARGGMGAVLKGRDPDLGRELAVKVLLEGHRDNPELVRRFVEEAQIGGQLQHPGVVPVYELGTFADRRPYFTMKLVKGRTLAELLASGPRPADDLPRFLAIFEQVCQTVAYAHARGVIHRDLKPSNVMVGGVRRGPGDGLGPGQGPAARGGGRRPGRGQDDPVPETVIATARSGSDGSDRSLVGSVLGTPAYMAPEQARGEIDRIDERADVFALGSILCEILTGEPAFTGRHRPRSSARRRGATRPTPWRGWTPAGPMPS